MAKKKNKTSEKEDFFRNEDTGRKNSYSDFGKSSYERGYEDDKNNLMSTHPWGVGSDVYVYPHGYTTIADDWNTPNIEGKIIVSAMNRKVRGLTPLDSDTPIKFKKKKIELPDLEKYSEKILDIVSRNVKKYRKLRGLSQIELALEIGMNGGAYLGRVELRKPKHHFNIKHIAKISKVLDIDMCRFFEE